MAAGRGALLLAVAVVLGIVLLNAVDDGPADRVSTGAEPPDASPTTSRSAAPATTSTTAPVRPPQEVKVLSANGTNRKGAAGKARDVLRESGYNVLTPLDAKAASESAVYFLPTFEREAHGVALALALPPTAVQPLPDPPPVPDLRGANVVVVLGPELADRLVKSTPSTTAKAANTSTTSTSSS